MQASVEEHMKNNVLSKLLSVLRGHLEVNREDGYRIECPLCKMEVIEYEYFLCPDCDETMCLYCWESRHECNNTTLRAAD